MRRQKESLNVLANNATFRLIEGVLELGVRLREVTFRQHVNLICLVQVL